MLKVEGIDVFHGRIQALHQVSLHVAEGEIVAVLGANGAGKTTLLRTISGLLRARRGQIMLTGQRIERKAAAEIVRLGISHVPEGRGVFREFTVDENLRIASYTRKDKANVPRDREEVFRLFPVLQSRLHQVAGTLSGGEQQMLAVARVLITRPRLLLIDEMSLGLSPKLVQELFGVIRDINRNGTTVLIVEQNARMALKVAHTGYLLENGKVMLQGPASVLASDSRVEGSYMGVRAHAL